MGLIPKLKARKNRRHLGIHSEHDRGMKERTRITKEPKTKPITVHYLFSPFL